ncbi:hypothetical protein Suden_0127 [Sulfurimonas denitrificans DSM 1251]|uniref:Uncharacterized protein n=1 Tax=Sulfurimonas denitrificans (strain ATCC 33889 / DSM 1251) TaxID=326298 RepID=Q30UC3_SULDN|nr:DNA adenine methylase [Sulfurimonas denitrificans]ABB43408.1 hypothetical protein Suden_0127 [Sulfurimonas denitrificans DSM 1251]
MNYIGSKYKLSVFLEDEIRAAVEGSLSNKLFCDMFAGIAVVGCEFKQYVKIAVDGYKVFLEIDV